MIEFNLAVLLKKTNSLKYIKIVKSCTLHKMPVNLLDNL
jgi:hypothetical protein